MFRKVLVANRGEIACRVLRTLRSLGIPSVAVHHFVDRGAPHVAMADEAVELRGVVPTGAYLDVDQILRVCADLSVDAIHPGYGFLAENATFAERVAAAGITFIGPSAGVMRALGDKIRSRELAKAAGVPMSPSVTFEGEDDLARAEALGFPLLVKASAGGGGKGMKIVRQASELAASVSLAKSEAARYFGDARIYGERYLERPRHIEVQILGDGNGGILPLHLRECSIQRRYQKIIEESPAALDPKLRDAIIASAVKLASAAKYENAGTVEFILAADGHFYFLEMNTRLQVEHPVTEMITGLDLVEEQLRVAKTKTLRFAAADIATNGHAIEARICAEDPDKGFLPATGRIGLLRYPGDDGSGMPEGVRVDSGFDEGQAVTSAFDSLLMKVVTHGATRQEAIARMQEALAELVILGVRTNIDYLQRVFASEPFQANDLHTGFLDEHAALLAPEEIDAETQTAVAVVAALGFEEFRRAVHDVPEPYATLGRFRN